MKAIVFGGSGFIGSHVVEQLLAAGHQVTAAVRETSDVHFLKSIGVNLVTVDFSRMESIGKSIEGHEVVYNCTADVELDLEKALNLQLEMRLAKLLVEAAAKHGASRFIQLSTIVVYDFRTKNPIDESYIPKPDYPIQSLKLEKDRVIKRIGKELGIETIILRPASTIGLRDRKSFFSRLFHTHMIDQFPLAEHGEAQVSLVDTRDIGRAMAFLGTLKLQNADNGLFLLKGFDTTWRQLKKEMDLAVGTNAETVELPANDSTFAGKTLSINRLWNDAKIRNAGFQSLYTLKDSVSISVAELLEKTN